MSGEQFYMQGQGSEERAILEEMQRNPKSEHWAYCLDFVKPIVYAKAKGVSRDDQDDIIQEVMYRVAKALPGFRFESSFRTWLFTIIDRCIKDKYRADQRRKLLHEEPLYHFFVEQLDDAESTGDEFRAQEELSAEKVFEIHEKMRLGFQALEDYIRTHANQERNRIIIQTVIREGHSYVIAAKRARCNAPVVGYIIREVQLFTRERMRAYEKLEYE